MRYLLLYATILPILITGNHKPKAIINKHVPEENQVLDISPPTGYSRITMVNGVFGAEKR
jgi:hypothetical protein